jgi:hypothetical protein
MRLAMRLTVPLEAALVNITLVMASQDENLCKCRNTLPGFLILFATL